MPNGAEVAHMLSHGSDCTSSSDGSSSDLSESSQNIADKRKLLKGKLTAKIRKRSQARERGATPAFKKRDLSSVAWLKMWPVDTVCGYDLVSKRETALIKHICQQG